jgi:hypothetical protein
MTVYWSKGIEDPPFGSSLERSLLPLVLVASGSSHHNGVTHQQQHAVVPCDRPTPRRSRTTRSTTSSSCAQRWDPPLCRCVAFPSCDCTARVCPYSYPSAPLAVSLMEAVLGTVQYAQPLRECVPWLPADAQNQHWHRICRRRQRRLQHNAAGALQPVRDCSIEHNACCQLL